jgi:hypothetical protein
MTWQTISHFEMSKIRESANGAPCQIRLVGICNHNPATTVWCHANGSAAGKGIGMKSHDLLGAYGCSSCHDIYDRRQPAPEVMAREAIELAFWEGHARSLVLLIERGIIIVHRGKALVAA